MKKQKEKNKKAGVTNKKDEPAEVREQPSGAEEQSEARSEPTVPDPIPAPAEDKAEPENANNIGTQEQADHGFHTPEKPAHMRQPSLSLQSKMRSTSFRRTSVSQGPMSSSANGAKSPTFGVSSPDGDTMTDIYRKQAARLDELEKENRRLAKEASEAESRWKNMESELEELREASPEVAELRFRAQKADSLNEEIGKLVSRFFLIRLRFRCQFQSFDSRIGQRNCLPHSPQRPTSSRVFKVDPACFIPKPVQYSFQFFGPPSPA